MDNLMDVIVTNLTLPRLLFWEVGGIGLVMIILQFLILKKGSTIMSELDDLKSAIGDLAGAISRETADIGKVLDQLTGVIHPSDLKDLTASIRASVSNINDASAKLEAAVNPAPPSAPTSAEGEGGQTTGPGDKPPDEPPAGGGEGGQTTGPGAPTAPASGHLPDDFPGIKALEEAGEATFAKVRKRVEAGTLTEIPGIGDATAETITEALAKAGG